MYDRTIKPIPEAPEGRIKALVGITGIHMSQYRATWSDALLSQFRIFWRPQILSILLYEGILFGFGIGINVSLSVDEAEQTIQVSDMTFWMLLGDECRILRGTSACWV
jgi:hypothetical protein